MNKENTEPSDFIKSINEFGVAIIVIILASFIAGLPISFLWNISIVHLFDGVNTMTYMQGVYVSLLFHILFSGK